MKLLTPISHLFKDKNDAQKISAVSDFLEARERTSDIRLKNTTHYHIDFDLNIGINEDQMQFLIDKVKPRDEIQFLTFQASRDCYEIELRNGIYYPISKPIPLEQQIENTKKSLKQIKNIIGSDRSIGIENNNYYPTGAYDICTSTKYLTEVINSLNCDLLFDIAHALVTCTNKKISFANYSKNLLDTRRCTQIHLCQPKYLYDGNPILAIDAHEIPSFELTELSIKLCKKWGIGLITVEYYKNAELLISYLNFIKEKIILHG